MVRKKQTTVEKAAAQAENGDLVIDEVRRFLQEEAVSVPTPLTTEHTYGEWNLSFGGNEDVRPSDKLRFDIVDRMLRSGIVIFALEAKRSQVFRVFSEGRFKVESPDEELAEIAEAALRLILTRMAADVTYSSFAYGAYFGEMTFELADRYHLGLSDQAGGDQFWIPKVPAACHPRTIKHIRRKANREFDGFEQEPDLRPRISLETIKVLPPQALVVPINSHFRNLWGTSFLTPIYPLWVWYEIILRVMARYMDRMATPVTLAKAPSRGTVTLTDGSTPVRSLQLALRLAESVSKSNAVAIPSDRDENGQPLWEMGYLTADERSQPFIQVLEFIGQEIIRAALSADRALSQPSVASGGVGSMAIGEVHASASAVTAEMLLLEILWYLNKYFMPKISLFNRGRNGPPLWLKVQALDTRERELLMQLVNVAGNSPASQELFNMIDWQTLGETSNIPMLSEEKAQERKDKLAQEALDKMKAQQELLSETKTFPQAKEENPAQKEEDEERRKLEEVVLDLVEQGKLPWLIGDQEAEYVLDEEGRLKLFNPFRDRLGRFASKSGGGGAGGGIVGGRGGGGLSDPVDVSRRNPGSWRKTTGAALKFALGLGGAAALGAVGLAVLGAVGASASEDEPEPGETLQDLIDKGIIDKATAEQLKKEGVSQTDRLPEDFKPKNFEEARLFYDDKLRDLGFEIDESTNVVISGQDLPPGAMAGYLYTKNEIQVRPTFARTLQDGDPSAINVYVHERLHQRQFGHPDSAGILGADVEDVTDMTEFVEGHNELLTDYVVGQITGQPGTFFPAYNDLSQAAAGMIVASGGNINTLSSMHVNMAGNYYQNYDYVQSIFPDRLPPRSSSESISLPPASIINAWLLQDYDIYSDEAVQELLGY